MEIQKIHSTISTDSISTEVRAHKHKNNQTLQTEVVTSAPKQTSISQDWQLLEKSQVALQSLDDVDTNKVNALRDAINNGDFNLDLAQVAEKMMKQHG
ncbi:flagellar biosynthesis anti-sigma factor FlgM [Shewanella frigidimarina]|uniref:Negative regulator of flagellin synthesis n=1 Tax=Shewanella frigidimarina TaxID=56812 RepID=A0A106BWB0_SHEFR|nr:flagellar biosynthesis anti-sigma factor FlgM [Shewanella frigidimarina]KVW99801.1 flagellar biosynthesis anti-sigma factor FlgM [Shewanella frigidimarina]